MKLAAVLTPLLLASCSHTPSRTFATSVPLATPTCGARLSAAPLRNGLVTVDPNPTSLLSVWIGPTSGACTANTVVRSEGTIVVKLAADVRAARKFPGGKYSCPADRGIAVWLYFSYPDGRTEFIDAELSGCGFIRAPGIKDARGLTSAFEHDLALIAPPTWKPYFV